jgi:hypothetical protein
MTLPSLQAIAKAFKIDYFPNFQLSLGNGGIFNSKYPAICELNIDPDYKQYPRVMSKMDENGKFSWMSMEHMQPELDKEEFDKIMNY